MWKLFQQYSSQFPGSSSRALPSQFLPLVLESDRELMDRISSGLDRAVWRCAATNCGKELRGRKRLVKHNKFFFKHNKFYYCLSCWNSMSNTGTGSMSTTGAESMSSTVAESSPQYACSSTRCGKPLTGKRAHDWFKHNGEYVCADCWAKKWGPWLSCYQCTIRPVWQYMQGLWQ